MGSGYMRTRPWIYKLTDTAENIIFPQSTHAGGKKVTYEIPDILRLSTQFLDKFSANQASTLCHNGPFTPANVYVILNNLPDLTPFFCYLFLWCRFLFLGQSLCLSSCHCPQRHLCCWAAKHAIPVELNCRKKTGLKHSQSVIFVSTLLLLHT